MVLSLSTWRRVFWKDSHVPTGRPTDHQKTKTLEHIQNGEKFQRHASDGQNLPKNIQDNTEKQSIKCFKYFLSSRK